MSSACLQARVGCSPGLVVLGYATMPEGRPEQWLIDLTDRAAYLQGRYLTSYAQCEFLLADLSVKVDNRFRYALDKRINAAKAMADSDGPLNGYAAEVQALSPMLALT
jgi:hypothetical protein